MTDTNDIRDEFSPLLDDELSPDARDTVEAELAQDANLLRELDALRKVDELYRGLPRASAPDDMAVRVQEQLHPKLKVTRLRTRKVSRTLYTSLAAAAMFSVLIGGVVIRNQFVVSPSPVERLVASAPVADKVAAEEAPGKEVATLGDAASAEPVFEAEADSVRPRPGRRAARETYRDDTAKTEVRLRQESFENAPAIVSEAPALAGGLMEQQPKDEAKAQTLAAAAPPPPAAPVVNEGLAIGSVKGKADEEAAQMALTADADATDLPLAVEAQSRLEKKRANAVERIADRAFDRREDGWYQHGYNGEPTQIVLRGSETMSTLAAAIPGLNDILALKGDVVFQHDKSWYRVPSMIVGRS